MPETAALEPITRAYLARVSTDDIDKKKRKIVAKINTAALDRYQTVIDPKGVDLRSYNSNRVVLWEHGMDPARGSLPVGRNSWIRPAIGPNGPELIAETHFYTRESGKGDDFTEQLFECYASGDMRAFSVRVIPKGNCSPPTADEIRSRPELADCYMMYRSSDLGEYSAVSVPGNQECLTLDEARSIMAVVKRGLTLPAALVQRAEETVHKPIRYALMKDGPKWHVIDERGGIISEHETREDAMLHMDQLAAEQSSTADHGAGGDDDTTKQIPVALSLPPLPGRSLADSQADLAEQLRKAFDLSAITQQIIDRRDQLRGRV
jgi:hypothetical protein